MQLLPLFIPRTLRESIEKVYSQKERQALMRIFGADAPRVQQRKIELCVTLQQLMRRRRTPFGMLIVYGWKKKWFDEYASFPDATQNVFKEKPYDMATHAHDHVLDMLGSTTDFDGAILATNQGKLIASGVYLENIRPKDVAEHMKLPNADDLSSAFGFAKKVHTRHLAGIACSYRLRGTTVYVLSEEQRVLRVFEKGKIVFSTLRSEMNPI